jgi:RHS repeat-associated protein
MSEPQTRTKYAYDYDNLIEETNASGSVVTRYTQGENIDEPLAMLRSSATSYYDADGIGSITSLSNGSSTISQTYGYDAFGKQTSSSGSLTNPFQFTGREFDSETSLYFDRARYYDPQTGRFLTEDPIGFDGGINFYAYVLNNPASFVDPFGLKLCKVFLPGLGNTYLDDSFYPRVKKWMDANDKAGIPIDFSQGFRTTEQQQALASDPAATTPAAPGNSLHEAGFAVDIRWSKVPKSQQGIVVQNATNVGLVWGGNFKHPKPDPVHFQRDPGNRKDRIKEAQDEYNKGVTCECAK